MSTMVTWILLLGLTASAQSFSDQVKLNIPAQSALKSRSLQLKGINIFDILKKLDICYLKCKDKYCECCQKIKILFVKVEVCATVDFKPTDKIAEIGLKVSGLKVVSTKAKLERHFCRPISSKIGPLELCVDTNIPEDGLSKASFPVCFKVQVSYEGMPSAQLIVGCSSDSVQADGEYHSVASLKVLNGEQVAKAIQKIVAGGSKN